MTSTVLYYKQGALTRREPSVAQPVDLQQVIETYADTANPSLWDWRNFHGLVVMQCAESDETFIVYCN